jgi:hypothetical protein
VRVALPIWPEAVFGRCQYDYCNLIKVAVGARSVAYDRGFDSDNEVSCTRPSSNAVWIRTHDDGPST